MPENQKFKALKAKKLQKNEKEYGKEIRERFGDKVVDESNEKYAGMDKAAYERMERMSKEIIELLLKAMDEGNTRSENAKRLVALHKDWLMIFWPSYSAEAHIGLAHGYVEDERFKAYYDQHRPGAAQFLRDCILEHVKE